MKNKQKDCTNKLSTSSSIHRDKIAYIWISPDYATARTTMKVVVVDDYTDQIPELRRGGVGAPKGLLGFMGMSHRALDHGQKNHLFFFFLFNFLA